MQQFLNNKYVRLGALTLGIGLLLWAVIWLACMAAGLTDFPVALEAVLAFLAAGVLVYKFLAGRVF
jgi:hypothetical protein